MAGHAPRHAIEAHWSRGGLLAAILEGLAASGKDVRALTVDDLEQADQFHGGGKATTVRLARLAGMAPGMRVLDVGGGLGGPARTLAVEFGCRVCSLDLTASYARAAAALTERLGLQATVVHRVGDALELPFPDAAFDAVWTQNSGMNIADKARLYAGFRRVLRAGGVLAFQEPMAGPVRPPIFPLMWARDPSLNFLLSPSDLRALVERTGFTLRAWEDVTADTAGTTAAADVPPYAIQRLVMGPSLEEVMRSGRRNRVEHRVVSIQAVFTRD